MRTHSTRRRERGVALLVALFALLLLSAIGLGMMYSADTETYINANYKDKQVANYAAVAGLQEGRDRLQPATGDLARANGLTGPTGLPSTSSANVIYIINPKSGETIEPWTAGSTYMDTELCQENVMGLSGSIGVPCTSLPSGSSWYTSKDDSQTSAGSWHLSSPLDYKWIRITTKADNMTPVLSNGSPATSTQVCWDGQHQIPVPSGYGADCHSVNGLADILVTLQGAGYNATPNVTIAAPSSGTQATATAHVTFTSTGQIASVTVTSPGSGYTTAPTVAITGDGTGATATATVVPYGQQVSSASINTTGTGCYNGAAPSVSFSGGGGSGATASPPAVSGNTCVYSWNVTGSCPSQKGNTVSGIGLSGGNSDFSGTITFHPGSGAVTSFSVQDPGSNYTSAPTVLTNLTGCGTGLTVTSTLGFRVQTGPLTITNGGGGYTSAPTVVISPPAVGTSPTGSAVASGSNPNAGQVSGVTVTAPGTGYTAATVGFTPIGPGSGVAATANIGVNGKVTSITVDNPGSGYDPANPPTVTLVGGGYSTQATAKAEIAYGPWYGQVFLVTTLAQTAGGARTMTQSEVATPVRGMAVTGALTLDGPSPAFDPPNSNQFIVNGNDANSCGGTQQPVHPAVGVYDDPNNPTSPSADTSVTTAINGAQPANYIGAEPAPDVENVFSSLGDMNTPVGMESLANAVASVANNTYPNTTYPTTPVPWVAPGSAGSPVIDVVNGDANISGTFSGYGILLVRGSLTFSGNFSWHGAVLIIGEGAGLMNGGGNGQIVGTVWVANTKDSSGNLLPTLGSPNLDWNGGGGNGIQYDHCWADNLMAKVPFVPPATTRPLTILSTRNLTY